MADTGARPHYLPDNEQAFHRDLQCEVHAWMAQRRDHRFADRASYAQALMLALLCIAGYLICLRAASAGPYLAGYLLFMLTAMLLNVNVNHDASHNCFFPSRRANRLVGRLVTLPLGVDPDYWRLRHVDYHHHCPNVEHHDLDTEENGFLRQTPYQPRRALMRFQHWYWPLIAALSLPYIAWIFDWSDRSGRTRLKEKRALTGRCGWLLFVSSKVLHLTLVLLLPLLLGGLHGISAGTVLIGYALGQMLASLLVVFLLLGTHWAQAQFYQLPASGALPLGWYKHNFATACDWLPTPRWLGHWLGGLNLHLTHHLFPGWHHRHCAPLAQILQRVARRHGMAYRCISYRQLIAQQQQFLRAMGRGDTLPPVDAPER